MLASSKIRHLSRFRWLVPSQSQSIRTKALSALAACRVQDVQTRCGYRPTKQGSYLRKDAHPSSLSHYRRAFHSSPSLYEEVQTVNCPKFPESISEGDIRWSKAVGDSVEADEEVGLIETDKTEMSIFCPAAGVIEELVVADGQKVTEGVPIFRFRVGEGGGAAATKAPAPAAAPPPPEPAAKSPPPPPTSASAGPIPDVAPPPTPVPTSPMASTPTSAVKPKAAGAAPTVLSGSRSEQRVKMNRMRQRIAQRLKDAQNSCAMLTTFNEIDMSNVMEMRNRYKEPFLKKFNLKLGFMSAFVKAAAFALQDQPVVNAVIDGDEIVYRDYIDISVAVATPKGLVVPVIRNVEVMNFADIEKTIAELGEKARSGSLAIEDMDGGTFTISNGGVFGSLFGTPIINLPQSAILGMHGIFERPMAVNGKVEIRPMMYVALTYDHKLIDGREAVTFLRKIKSAVEDPRTILLDL